VSNNKAGKGGAQVFNNCTGNVTLSTQARVGLGLGPLAQFLSPRAGAVAVSRAAPGPAGCGQGGPNGGPARQAVDCANSVEAWSLDGRALADVLACPAGARLATVGAESPSGPGVPVVQPRAAAETGSGSGEPPAAGIVHYYAAPLSACGGALALASSLTCTCEQL
jgi:hypothetical protein